jgi:pyrimidine-nucleoside phosphorylase
VRSVYEILRAKRDGCELAADEIARLVEGAVDGSISDYQVAAFLMAVAIRGMTTAESAALTLAMRDSGEVWDLGDLAPVVDKHSTGGVGDKVTLVLAPLVAACGARVGIMSGRGLGHTGGTLDKLAAIPGFRTAVTLDQFRNLLKTVGAALVGQTEEIAPADRVLYALRDVTGTVESIPLIAASILSKKLACGTTGIVFDVKSGDGAFMKRRPDAERLGRVLVDTAREAGRRAGGLLTDMSRPLGRAIGNALEVEEAIHVLRGGGPKEVRELSIALGSEMLRFSDPTLTASEARERLDGAIEGGAGAAKLAEIIERQHGDPRVVEDPAILPQPSRRISVRADRDGFVQSVAAERLGFLSVEIGCGRRKRDDAIELAAGFLMEKTVGDSVAVGEPVATVCLGRREIPRADFLDDVRTAFEIGERHIEPPERILAAL